MARTYRALFPFCGLGAGALGFQQARHEGARFEVLGGLDNDAIACRSFELLTGAPAWCVDVLQVEPRQLRERYGEAPPDVVFFSPPCKGSSGLLPASHAGLPHYVAMNQLALIWCHLMLAAWATDKPRLLLLENVPRITSRAPEMLRALRKILGAAGYVIHEEAHDCGVLGGLAQHRQRFLMVARHTRSVEQLLYQPPPQRVRGCGEVLGALPLPEDPAAGPMHELSEINWTNWLRLASIPAGGDWRDLPGVVAPGQRRADVWKRHGVEAWGEAVDTVAGPGSNGPSAVADPRLPLTYETRQGTNRVTPWAEPVPTVTSNSGRLGHCSGGLVADPRLPLGAGAAFNSGYGVLAWEQPAHTVTGQSYTSCGTHAVADPRLSLGGQTPYPHSYGVLGWSQASHTVAGKNSPGCGAYAVSDPRLGLADNPGRHHNKYRVGEWEKPAGAVIGATRPGSGAASIADPRAVPARRILSLAEALALQVDNPRRPPPVLIVAPDGTWHRPLTTLELAVLQGLPAVHHGRPLVLEGGTTRAREHIGNAVPVGTARAIAEQMLRTLSASDSGELFLSSSDVWVSPPALLTQSGERTETGNEIDAGTPIVLLAPAAEVP